MQVSLPAIWSQSLWDASTATENGAWLHCDLPWLHRGSIPASSLQDSVQLNVHQPRTGPVPFSMRDSVCCRTDYPSLRRNIFIYQCYESLHLKLKLFLGEIGTVSKLNYELPNHHARLALERVQNIDASWTGSPWTPRDWNSHLFHIQGLEGMNFGNSRSAGPNPEKYFIWDYSGNILSEETS